MRGITPHEPFVIRNTDSDGEMLQNESWLLSFRNKNDDKHHEQTHNRQDQAFDHDRLEDLTRYPADSFPHGREENRRHKTCNLILKNTLNEQAKNGRAEPGGQRTERACDQEWIAPPLEPTHETADGKSRDAE